MTDDSGRSLSAEALYERLRRGERVDVLDVRDRDEFERWRVDGAGVDARQAPYARFVQARVRGTIDDVVAELDLDGPVVAVCARGEASGEVAAWLREAGVDAANLADGMNGWARVYEGVELDAAGTTVVQYRRPSSGCLSYLVVDGGEAAVIDPLRAFAERYAADAAERGAELRYAVETHVHADHVSGVREVADLTGASVAVPEGAIDRGLDYDREVRTVADGDELRVGGATLAAVALPGHTSEMTGYRLGDLLFAGDTLFLSGVARPDLEAGAEGAERLARRLHATLAERLGSLPPETRIAPGHYVAGIPTAEGACVERLGTLRSRLEALSLDEDAFVEEILGSVPPRPNNYEAIVETNLGRRTVDDETAFELELGPNNCAA